MRTLILAYFSGGRRPPPVWNRSTEIENAFISSDRGRRNSNRGGGGRGVRGAGGGRGRNGSGRGGRGRGADNFHIQNYNNQRNQLINIDESQLILISSLNANPKIWGIINRGVYLFEHSNFLATRVIIEYDYSMAAETPAELCSRVTASKCKAMVSLFTFT